MKTIECKIHPKSRADGICYLGMVFERKNGGKGITNAFGLSV